jgi:hypothetical protein
MNEMNAWRGGGGRKRHTTVVVGPCVGTTTDSNTSVWYYNCELINMHVNIDDGTIIDMMTMIVAIQPIVDIYTCSSLL